MNKVRSEYDLQRFFRMTIRVLVGIVLVLLVGCGEGDELGSVRGDGVVVHPFTDSIPHYNRDHIPIDRRHSLDDMDVVPKELGALADYLSDPENTDIRTLDIFVNSAFNFDVTSVDDSLLVVLDSQGDRLLEYNLQTDEATMLAEHGAGPGYLRASRDMARNGDRVYVTTLDRRIIWFNCRSAPCQHEGEIKVSGFGPVSVAPAGKQFVVLGRDGGAQRKDGGAVRFVNQDGKITGSFGETYRSAHPMLRKIFIQGARVRHIEELDRYALVFSKLPVIYIYDNVGHLQNTYKVSPFINRAVKFGNFGRPETVRLSPEDRSYLSDARVLGGHILLLTIGTHQLIEKPGPSRDAKYASRIDYFAVDLKDEKSYHVGSDMFEGPIGDSRTLFVTQTGIVINEAGALSFYNF